jgi:microcystin-dependent protein
VGGSLVQGQRGGEESHTLILSELSTHIHAQVAAQTAGPNAPSPVGDMACASGPAPYSTTVNTTMAPQAVGNAGGSQPHANLQPYLCLKFIVALQGIFPSQN